MIGCRRPRPLLPFTSTLKTTRTNPSVIYQFRNTFPIDAALTPSDNSFQLKFEEISSHSVQFSQPIQVQSKLNNISENEATRSTFPNLFSLSSIESDFVHRK